MTKLPLTIVGGFLGAGKTTLLNHILGHAGGRLAVLVNDFGAVNVDADLIASHDGATITLSNGCVCCSIGDSLADALIAVSRHLTPPDHVVIEASGVADPGRIAELAYLDRAFALQGVVVVVDSERVRALAVDKYVGDTVERQITAADLVVANKADRVSPAALQEAQEWLRGHAPHALVVPATKGALPIEVLLGFDPDHWGGFLRVPSRSRHDPAVAFASFVFEAERPFKSRSLEILLDNLPSSVLRIKGRITMDDGDRPAVLQLVGKRWELTCSAGAAGAPRTRLVVIAAARALDWKDLRARMVRALT